MKIRFQTKEESNRLQQEAFLKLSKPERFLRFLKLVEQCSIFPVKHKPDKSGNFTILIPSKR